MENLEKLILELVKQDNESEWIEFKHNNSSPEAIGERISALANGATLTEHSFAYLIFGVNDTDHTIVGTDINLRTQKKGNEELENWLRHRLSLNADFSFETTVIEEKRVEVIVIAKAMHYPVTFEKEARIRVGSYVKKLKEYPAIESRLWGRLNSVKFEDIEAMSGLTIQEVRKHLDCDAYFKSLNLSSPSNEEGYAHYLSQDKLIRKEDNGLYTITNLGAILFAQRLSDFPRLGRKALRVVLYQGRNKLNISKDETFDRGYAIIFEEAVKYIYALLPTAEDISIHRVTKSKFPLLAIREAIANSLIHQDFSQTGNGPLVELFDNRIEVTNPGIPLVDIHRIVDNPPRSRNEDLAAFMRRIKICEELGSGWDRMVMECEKNYVIAPKIAISNESTQVSILDDVDFWNISIEDRLWSTYMHAIIKYLEGDFLTNSSLRERFGLEDKSAGSISRLINDAIEEKLIRPHDPTTAKRYMKYSPIWA